MLEKQDVAFKDLPVNALKNVNFFNLIQPHVADVTSPLHRGKHSRQAILAELK
jgi:hypothetical protein